MEIVLAIVLLLAVGAFVAAPVRSQETDEKGLEDPRTAELEARKQAKYREIRDTELDHAQGKISDAEFATQNAELRREAIEILKEIDEHQAAGDR